ncbi:MAG: carbohydrate ABC transporter permease [Deinococcales bacterium]
MKSARLSGTWLGKIVVAMVLLFVLLPILWLAYSAFLPPDAIFQSSGVPTGFTFENFAKLPFDALIRPLILSLIVSSSVAFLQLCVSLPAAYAIRGGTRLLPLYLLLLSIPAELMLIPLYGLLKDLQLLNNPLALVLPFVANPFIVFLLYSGMAKLPWTFIEAARLDGAHNIQILLRVVAPLLRPEMTAAAVLGFAAHWNLVLYPKVVLDNPQWWTVQVALTEMLRKDPNAWGKLGAAAMVTSLPILILYIFFESRVTKTLEGGLK